jgi:hypothetical protein
VLLTKSPVFTNLSKSLKKVGHKMWYGGEIYMEQYFSEVNINFSTELQNMFSGLPFKDVFLLNKPNFLNLSKSLSLFIK